VRLKPYAHERQQTKITILHILVSAFLDIRHEGKRLWAEHQVLTFNHHINQCTYIKLLILKHLRSLQHVSILRSSSGFLKRNRVAPWRWAWDRNMLERF